MKNYINLLLALFLINNNNYSQEEVNKFSFQVLDIETKEPISYATVLLKKQNKGTHADYEGFFQLPTFLSNNETFVITAIGYNDKEFITSNYSKYGINKIYLTKSIYVLNEIILNSHKNKQINYEAKDIVQLAIDKILINHSITPYSYIAHYRDYLQPKNDIYKKSKNLKEDVKYLNLNEGVVEVFDSGFKSEPVSDVNNQVALYEFKLNDKFLVDTTLIMPYDNFNAKFSKGIRIESFGGNELNILKTANPVRNYKSHSISFINTFYSDFVKNHYFKIEGKKLSQKDTLYEISFRSIKAKTTKIHKSNGKIYISKNNFAIFKLNYYLFLDGIKNPKYSLNLEYKPNNGKMYLDYISFNNLLEIKNTEQTELNYIGYITENNTLVFSFNNPVNYDSIKYWKKKISLFFDKKRLKIAKISIQKPNFSSQNTPFLLISIENSKLKSYLENNKNTEDFLDRISIHFKKAKDNNQFLINEAPSFKFYQFRELFVQKIFIHKTLPNDKIFIDKNLPLLKANLAPFDFKNDFWIHTPLKTIE